LNGDPKTIDFNAVSAAAIAVASENSENNAEAAIASKTSIAQNVLVLDEDF
jgi:hypothetical protein